MKKDSYYQKLEEKGYYKTIDKRSKDYRDYKEWLKYKQLQENVDKENTIGLGDVVEKVTKATGIKKVVDTLVDDCGCSDRKDKFNKLFSWKRNNIKCIKPEDYTWLKSYLKTNTNKHTFDNRQRFIEIYNYVFNARVKNTSCSSCLRDYLGKLKKYLQVYDN